MKSTKEDREMLFDAMAAHLVKCVGDAGGFKRVSLVGTIEGTGCSSLLEIGPSADGECRGSLGVHRLEEDRLISNLLFHGAFSDAIRWLKSAEGAEEIAEAYAHLEARVLQED